MKRFENVMFVPKGYVREIKPVCNGELDNLSIELMNKTSVVNLRESGAEVHMEELTKVCSGDFSWTETLFKVLVSMESCMRADLNSKMSVNHGGWEKMRNNVVECCLRFDSTIKLWDATRKESTLFQELPHTIFYEGNSNYFKFRRLGIPTSLKEARREYRSMSQILHGDRSIPHLSSWDFDVDYRKRLRYLVKVASFVIPRTAVRSNNLSKNVRHSLKTELLAVLKTNGVRPENFTAGLDDEFADLIRKFQEPTEQELPRTFATCYKTSLYACCPDSIAPAIMWDSQIKGQNRRLNTAVEFNFISQCLVSPWLKKYDVLHGLSHKIPVKEVLSDKFNMDGVEIKRSNSTIAKAIRGDCNVENMDLQTDDCYWTGRKHFKEIKVNQSGLRLRKNGLS